MVVLLCVRASKIRIQNLGIRKRQEGGKLNPSMAERETPLRKWKDSVPSEMYLLSG